MVGAIIVKIKIFERIIGKKTYTRRYLYQRVGVTK